MNDKNEIHTNIGGNVTVGERAITNIGSPLTNVIQVTVNAVIQQTAPAPPPEGYARKLRAEAEGFREGIVMGRVAYALKLLGCGDSGCRTFLRKIDTQRLHSPVLLLSADTTTLTDQQCAMLGSYRSLDRELEDFITYVVKNMDEFHQRPKDALKGYRHRLGKLSSALDNLIESLG